MFQQLKSNAIKTTYGGTRRRIDPRTNQPRVINPGPMQVNPTRPRHSYPGPGPLIIGPRNPQNNGSAGVRAAQVAGGAGVVTLATLSTLAVTDYMGETDVYNGAINQESE